MLDKLRFMAERAVSMTHHWPQQPAPDHPLLTQVRALSPQQDRELACAVSMLWDTLVDELGGVDDLRARNDAEQTGFIRVMEAAAQRIRGTAPAEKTHYALAPELMALYVDALRRAEHLPLDQEIATVAARLCSRGALVRRAGGGQSGRADTNPVKKAA
jgi:hypothetical protein